MRPRAREAGVVPGILPPGPLNAITDVPGVRVGQITLREAIGRSDRGDAVLPHGGNLFRDEVFITPVDGTGGVRRVSYGGGVEPLWAPTGDLFFRNRDQMFVVDVRTRPDLVVGQPRKIFEGPYELSPTEEGRNFDVTADAQRFLMVRRADPGEDPVP